MKKIFFLLILFVSIILPSYEIAYGRDTYVRGYTRKDGTYVKPHYRTSPNSTRNDNYSTKGNINPYTGEYGTKPRDNYGSGSFGGSNGIGGWNNQNNYPSSRGYSF